MQFQGASLAFVAEFMDLKSVSKPYRKCRQCLATHMIQEKVSSNKQLTCINNNSNDSNYNTYTSL